MFLVYLLQWQGEDLWSGPAPIGRAFAFTATLMGILLAHELGHFGTARLHGFRLTLPWFLPAPFLVGTFGAIIRMEGRPRDRSALLEMGAMGPLAGLAVVVAVMTVRLVLGGPDGIEGGPTLGRPLIWWILSAAVTGHAAEPVSTQDPMAFAAWIGCLLTSMNLLPFGQLDGGHVLHALWPRWSERAAWIVTALLLLGGTLWTGWLAWIVVLHLLGTRSPVAVKDLEEPPSPRARAMGALCLAAFLLCFLPVPA